jgi:hypothetical protein
MSPPPAALPQVESMTLGGIQAELRQVTGKPWTSDADGARRQALWKRLDHLAAEGQPKPKPSPTAAPPRAEGRPKPPGLQELVARFGGYNKIPPEAWAGFDRQMAEYHSARRTNLTPTREPKRYNPKLGTCQCPQCPIPSPGGPVPHEFRIHSVTGEYVLVCTRCSALWDHQQTNTIIASVCNPLSP